MKTLPERPRLQAAEIAGPAQDSIRLWDRPTLGAPPRRIAIGPDDMISYKDFARGFVGRLDPATGKVTESRSPSGPKSEPYGIVFTKSALRYNEFFAKPNTIIRFDPQTEKFQTWMTQPTATLCATCW